MGYLSIVSTLLSVNRALTTWGKFLTSSERSVLLDLLHDAERLCQPTVTSDTSELDPKSKREFQWDPL